MAKEVTPEQIEMLDGMVAKARAAAEIIATYDQERVDRLCQAVAASVIDMKVWANLADEAVDETGLGDKVTKRNKRNKLKLILRDCLRQKSVGVIEEIPEKGIVKYAKPVGVIASLVPTTNPCLTPAGQVIYAIKARDVIICSPHPRAKKTTNKCINIIRETLVREGAPADIIQGIEEPSITLTQELMKRCDLVIATGGRPMVKSAYSSGRPSYGVGPGNVQVVVAPDWTDYDKLAKQVVGSRSYDNGMPCTGEQAIHLPADKVEQMKAAFVKQGAYILSDEDAKKLPGILFTEKGTTDPAHVGMLPSHLAKLMGLDIPDSTTLLLFPSQGMTRENMLRREKLCPVVQFFPYENFEEGVSNAKSNLMWEGKGHSSVVYTNDEDCAKHAALELPVSRLLVNQPAGAASGGNFINGLVPTMSLGCGSWGNNSISDNLSYKHLMNTTKLAFYHDPTIPEAEKVWAE